MVLALVLSSCAPGLITNRETSHLADSLSSMPYSIVCIIHGDGDYLYHDSNNEEHVADVDALAKVQTVAEQNPQAEVFIFHERPKTHYLLFFPQRDGDCYVYRGGHLIASESYRRNEGTSRFDPEVALYDKFHVDAPSPAARIFLYFGHEIPEFAGTRYDRSYSGLTFTVADLTDGLKRITRDTARFDLAILSTCYNGTPHTIAALAPYARIIVASPENLHLSYFDIGPLEHLETGFRGTSISEFAHVFAQHAFDQLTREVQTAVTVATYDADRAAPYLHYAAGTYDRTLASVASSPTETTPFLQHCDCAADAAYVLPGIHDGVDILFQPAHFGRSRNIPSHSGWECWKQQPISSLFHPLDR